MNSLTEENYLKAVYRLSQRKNFKITPSSIADEINVNAASVVEMIRKLTEKKLLHYDRAKGARLTEKGFRTALNIVRKHRLWEVFLLEKLGYTWDVVHEIAEQLEHIRHDELADRLDAFLGFPEYDPHGDPIPKSNGDIPAITNIRLAEMEEGKTCKVVGVKDTSPSFLQYLQQLSVGIGSKIKVLGKIPFDDSLRVQIGRNAVTTVSRKFAESLLVNDR
jgi:DtxR family Mn-dependent transcriptional regulator